MIDRARLDQMLSKLEGYHEVLRVLGSVGCRGSLPPARRTCTASMRSSTVTSARVGVHAVLAKARRHVVVRRLDHDVHTPAQMRVFDPIAGRPCNNGDEHFEQARRRARP